MRAARSWGPTHQKPSNNRRRHLLGFAVLIAALCSRTISELLILAALVAVAVRLHRRYGRRLHLL